MPKNRTRTIAVGLLCLALMELLTCVAYRPPAVIPASDAGGVTSENGLRFSAERAIQIHRKLLPNEPHPAGSSQQAAVRERLVVMLEKDGWDVEIQSGKYAWAEANTVELFNVIATRSEWADFDIRPLVLSTHYDSCPFGPGAGDAGGCVATLLEAGRLLTSKSQVPQRPL
ncbi:MAG: M28 family peptidase, partial [Planctomycetaceae bacterium]